MTMNGIVLKAIIAITLLLWLALSIMLRGKSFNFDATGTRYSFHSVFVIYRQIYAGIFIFGGVLATIVEHVIGYRIILALSSVYALLFVLWLTFQYEGYQHLRYRENGRSPYAGWKYAVTLTLGAMSPLLFAVGLVGMVYGQ